MITIEFTKRWVSSGDWALAGPAATIKAITKTAQIIFFITVGFVVSQDWIAAFTVCFGVFP
jgi:hypothetical protein